MQIPEHKPAPALRFPEFLDDWEVKKLGDVYSFRVTNSFSRENLNYEKGTVKNIHYGDIHTKFATIFDIQKEYVPFINPEIAIQKIATENYCKEGDLVIADASEDYEDIGKSIELVNLNNEKLLAGLHTLLARPNLSKIAIGFAGHLMKSESVRFQIKKIAQGTKVLSISAGRLSDIMLNNPTLPEQTKIGNFLTAVDTKIQGLRKEKSLLEQYKKGMMQRIFSQILRFKDADNQDFPAWEMKTLGELMVEHKTRNKKNAHQEVFSVAKEKGVINQIEHLGRSYASQDVSNYKVVFPDDVIYTKSPTSDFPFGIVKQNKLGRIGIVSVLYAVFRPQNKFLGYILDAYFSDWKNTFNYLNPIVQKGAKNTMNISNDVFLSGATINLPISLSEQTKIANFLSAIDEKIRNCAERLEKMEAWKKGLLQQMFV